MGVLKGNTTWEGEKREAKTFKECSKQRTELSKKIVLQEQAFWKNRKETAQLTERKGIPICKMVLGGKAQKPEQELN